MFGHLKFGWPRYYSHVQNLSVSHSFQENKLEWKIPFLLASKVVFAANRMFIFPETLYQNSLLPPDWAKIPSNELENYNLIKVNQSLECYTLFINTPGVFGALAVLLGVSHRPQAVLFSWFCDHCLFFFAKSAPHNFSLSCSVTPTLGESIYIMRHQPFMNPLWRSLYCPWFPIASDFGTSADRGRRTANTGSQLNRTL